MNAMHVTNLTPIQNIPNAQPETAAMTAQTNTTKSTNRFDRLTRFTDRAAVVPAVTLGDPTPEASVEVLRTVIRAGADALSVTLPFSDPCAHAPDCAHASVRALEAGADMEQSLRLVRTIRDEYPDLPVILTLYANQIAVLGLEAFTAAAADAGVDALYIPDLPVGMRELEPRFDECAQAEGLALTGLLPPNADAARVGTLVRIVTGAMVAPKPHPASAGAVRAQFRVMETEGVELPVLFDADLSHIADPANAAALGTALVRILPELTGRKVPVAVAFGVGIAKILEAAPVENRQVTAATLERVEAFVGDVARMIRAVRTEAPDGREAARRPRAAAS